jgi:hypothetical protein
MKLSDLVFVSLFILADAAAAGRVENNTAYPNFFKGEIGDNGTKSRVFIKFVPGGKAAALSALGHVGGEVIHSFSELNTFSVSLPTVAIDALRRDPKIAFIEQDPIRSVGPIVRSTTKKASPFDRRRATQGQTVPYGVDMVQARDVWDANRDGVVDEGSPNGSNRMICIIDSGFLVSHEDLQGINVDGYDGNLPWNQDGLTHGTHVAGTIAAVNNDFGVVGVTPGTVNLYIVRVFADDGNWAYASTLINAANRCASAGANIISMSLGGGDPSLPEQQAYDLLYAQGILTIAAAGNDGNNEFLYPASYPSVMSVAAIDSNKAVASFSQRNSQVDIAAPGVGVLSTVGSSYEYYDGTSMATPHVSAVAALVWSAMPSATNKDVRSALYSSAEDLGVAGRDDVYGYGLVRAKLAIENLLYGTSMPTPYPTTSSPTVTQAPSTCIGSTPDWVDSDGDGCDVYEKYDLPGCPYYGSSFGGEMGVADDNCCYCFGTGVSVFDLVISGLIYYLFVSSYLSSWSGSFPASDQQSHNERRALDMHGEHTRVERFMGGWM